MKRYPISIMFTILLVVAITQVRCDGFDAHRIKRLLVDRENKWRIIAASIEKPDNRYIDPYHEIMCVTFTMHETSKDINCQLSQKQVASRDVATAVVQMTADFATDNTKLAVGDVIYNTTILTVYRYHNNSFHFAWVLESVPCQSTDSQNSNTYLVIGKEIEVAFSSHLRKEKALAAVSVTVTNGVRSHRAAIWAPRSYNKYQTDEITSMYQRFYFDKIKGINKVIAIPECLLT